MAISITDFSDIVSRLNSTSTVIDCGANVGQETIHIAHTGAKIHAFEPNPHAFAVLADSCKNHANVVCHQKAIGSTNGHSNLYLHENSDQDELIWSTGSSLVGEKSNVRKDKYVVVEVIDFIDFLDKIPEKVELIKMDVEGAEYDILLKLIESSLHNKVTAMFVETHAHKIPSLEGKHQQLLKLIKEKKIENINLEWQ